MGGDGKRSRKEKKGPVPRENTNKETKQNERQKKKVQKTIKGKAIME